MKPCDIVPGRKYRNANVEGIDFLGVKQYKTNTKGDFELFLVVISEDNFRYGSTVCSPEYCAEGYWDGFYSVED